jgi:hexosaminidase
MKFCKFVLLCWLVITIACKEETFVITAIIPQPNEIAFQKGTFTINEHTLIVIDDSEDALRISDEMRSFLKANFNLKLEVSSKDQENTIQLLIAGENESNGSYSLVISKSGILIKGSTYQGIFYGFQTLKQLLSPGVAMNKPVLNYVTIDDSPAFHWRGMMLDVSRHFFPKDSVKKVIDVMAMHKLNKFHWHLVDGIGWRIQIDQYPELTKRGAWRKVKVDKKPWEDYESTHRDTPGEVYGGFYSKEDIREIVAYAAERYIDVIPEIEMPGHSEAALQCYPEFICEGMEASGVYCAGNDGTFAFLQNIIDEVVELFPNQYLHIGGDEVGKGAWLQCTKCKKIMKDQHLEDGEALQSYFVKRMEAYIHAKNRKLIGWDEILEGGLPERATVMSWRGFQGGIEAANAGHDVVMSPGSPCYFDHSQGKSEFEPPSWGGYNNLLKVYDFNPVPADIDPDKRHHILGGQANLWTEQIKTLSHLEYMMLPRLCALSEALWTDKEKKDSIRFISKMDYHFDRLTQLGYRYAGSSLTPDYQVNFDKTNKEFSLSLQNELDKYDIRYTLDGTKPNLNSASYKNPIRYKEPIQVHAQCFRRGVPMGYPLIKLFSTGFGDQCKVHYSHDYSEVYSGGGDKALFDNKFAIARGDDPNWQGIPKQDYEVLIDLGGRNEMSYISLNFFQHIAATSVMLPTQVSIAISLDGKDYQKVFNEPLATIEKRDPIIRKIETEFKKQQVAFIKISAKNRGVLPEWHIRSGDAWIFVDEVSVR